jgi:hypothetical protein
VVEVLVVRLTTLSHWNGDMLGFASRNQECPYAVALFWAKRTQLLVNKSVAPREWPTRLAAGETTLSQRLPPREASACGKAQRHRW